MCRGPEAAAMCLESTSPSCRVCVSACAPTANRHADLPNRHADLPSRRSSSTNRRSLRRHCVEARSISSGMRLQPRRSCAVNTSDFKTRVVYPRTECACVPLSVAHKRTMLRAVHTMAGHLCKRRKSAASMRESSGGSLTARSSSRTPERNHRRRPTADRQRRVGLNPPINALVRFHRRRQRMVHDKSRKGGDVEDSTSAEQRKLSMSSIIILRAQTIERNGRKQRYPWDGDDNSLRPAGAPEESTRVGPAAA
jgi:hypothetical protein